MTDSNPSAVRQVEVAIAGAGFGGLCMAVQLKKAGIHDFVVLEKGNEVGGTYTARACFARDSKSRGVRF